jgi:hypothetical protein
VRVQSSNWPFLFFTSNNKLAEKWRSVCAYFMAFHGFERMSGPIVPPECYEWMHWEKDNYRSVYYYYFNHGFISEFVSQFIGYAIGISDTSAKLPTEMYAPDFDLQIKLDGEYKYWHEIGFQDGVLRAKMCAEGVDRVNGQWHREHTNHWDTYLGYRDYGMEHDEFHDYAEHMGKLQRIFGPFLLEFEEAFTRSFKPEISTADATELESGFVKLLQFRSKEEWAASKDRGKFLGKLYGHNMSIAIMLIGARSNISFVYNRSDLTEQDEQTVHSDSDDAPSASTDVAPVDKGQPSDHKMSQQKKKKFGMQVFSYKRKGELDISTLVSSSRIVSSNDRDNGSAVDRDSAGEKQEEEPTKNDDEMDFYAAKRKLEMENYERLKYMKFLRENPGYDGRLERLKEEIFKRQKTLEQREESGTYKLRCERRIDSLNMRFEELQQTHSDLEKKLTFFKKKRESILTLRPINDAAPGLSFSIDQQTPPASSETVLDDPDLTEDVDLCVLKAPTTIKEALQQIVALDNEINGRGVAIKYQRNKSFVKSSKSKEKNTDNEKDKRTMREIKADVNAALAKVVHVKSLIKNTKQEIGKIRNEINKMENLIKDTKEQMASQPEVRPRPAYPTGSYLGFMEQSNVQMRD